jgi:flagellar L-ring protein precursor FlgH
VSRESENDAINTGILGKVQGLGSIMGGINLNGATIESSGAGNAAQRASLNGSIAATVTEVLANGNLVVRGEKQLALTEGMEIIQVSGIIRPDDVSPNNTVQSRRLANAQIAYRGTGDLANASRPGWGTSGLLKFWPF